MSHCQRKIPLAVHWQSVVPPPTKDAYRKSHWHWKGANDFFPSAVRWHWRRSATKKKRMGMAP